MTILNGVPLEPQPPGGRPPRPVATPESQAVGRVAGVLALVLAFILPLAGIVVGAIALTQARAGGYTNGLAKAGLVTGIVLTVLGVLVIVALIVFVPSWVQGVIALCEEQGVVVQTPGSYECTL